MKTGPKLSVLLLSTALVVTGHPALAERGTPWQALDRDEQKVLKKHRKNWDSKDPGEQSRLREGARRYLQLPEDKRRDLQDRRNQYEKMSPDERKRLRNKYKEQKGRR